MSKILVKTKEISKLTSLSCYIIRRYVHQGLLPAYRVGGKDYLFDPDEVLELIKKRPVN